MPASISIKSVTEMHNFSISIALNLSIIFAAIAGLIRVRRISPVYYPFLIIVWFGLLNEILSIVMAYSIRNNSINSNVFVLIEYLLLLWQFYKWNDGNRKKYYLLACIGTLVWVADNLLINSLSQNNSTFRIFYSFIIVLLSINQINKIIIYEKGALIKNAMFIICITFLFYYGCKAFVETFNTIHLSLSNVFLWNLYIILYFVNVFSNVLYTLAILCIPVRQEFTLPY
jgi:hypothetical protein